MTVTKRLPKESGRDYAMRVLKENIISLGLPPGSMVSENELSAKLGISRTPIREALNDLSKVKIVDIYPQRGSFITYVDYAMVEQARFMRNLLECAVVEIVAAGVSTVDMKRLEQNVQLQQFYLDNDNKEMLMALDNEFHLILFEAADKAYVYSVMCNMSIHFDRVRSMALGAVKDSSIVRDHREILELMSQGDGAGARAQMEKHLLRYKIDEAAIREKFPQYFQ